MKYTLKSLSEARLLLPKWDLEEAAGVVTLAAKEGKYVNVLVMDDIRPDLGVTEVRLIDVTVMAEDEYIAYRQAGGTETYVPAKEWLTNGDCDATRI